MVKKAPKKPAKLPTKLPKSALPTMRCFLACDYAGRVAADNGEKTSLQGVFNVVWVENVPAAYGQFFLFIQLYGGKVKSALKIIATNGSGKKVMELITSTAIPFEPNETREVMAKVPILPVEEMSDIQFVASINGQKIGWPLLLEISKNSN